MKRTNTIAELIVAAGTLASIAPALGVGGPTAAPVGTAANPDNYLFVGRVRDMWGQPNTHIGTGSYLGDGRVLTCARTFSDVPPGAGFWYDNSNGLAEIAVNAGRADSALNLAIGTPVSVAP